MQMPDTRKVNTPINSIKKSGGIKTSKLKFAILKAGKNIQNVPTIQNKKITTYFIF